MFEKYGCTGCHPGVNPSLDLTAGDSYDQLVGIQALEDPTLYRVVAGDPERSLLYLKVGGDPPVADIPAIGTRMPPDAPPIDPADIDLVRRWILQGAKDADGHTKGPTVPSPGNAADRSRRRRPRPRRRARPRSRDRSIGQDREPIEGALVTLLLKGPDLPGREEHYRVAVTDAAGEFTLGDAPRWRYARIAADRRSRSGQYHRREAAEWDQPAAVALRQTALKANFQGGRVECRSSTPTARS